MSRMKDYFRSLDRKTIVKRIVLILLLVSCGVLIAANRTCLQVEKDVFMAAGDGNEYVVDYDLKGNRSIEQFFVAEYDYLSRILLRFQSTSRETAKGKVILRLKTEQGKVISTTSLDAHLIRHLGRTIFIMGSDSSIFNANKIDSAQRQRSTAEPVHIQKGRRYCLEVASENVTSEGEFGVRLMGHDTERNENYLLRADGKDLEEDLFGKIYYRHFAGRTIQMLIFLFIAALLFALIPFRLIDEKIGGERLRLSVWVTRAFAVLTPLVAFVAMQKFGNMSFSDMLEILLSYKGPLNMLLLGFLLCLIYLITNRLRLSALIFTIISGLFGFANYLLVLFREAPLLASDFSNFGTAMQVVSSYTVTFDKDSLWGIALIVSWCCMLLALPGYRGLRLKYRLIPLAACAILGFTGYYLFFQSNMIEDKGLYLNNFKPRAVYFKHGSPVSFMLTVRYSFVEKPEDYTVEAIEELSGKFLSDRGVAKASVSKKTPNVIVVMNESFSDLSVLGELPVNEDSMPFYHGLEKNVIKGWMHSSVFGSQTANSEFECLTGFTSEFLPYGSVAYRSQIKKEIPSLAYSLRDTGYKGMISFHPGMNNSYNRNNVYPLLGFDRFISKEELKKPDKLRDFISDEYDYQVVEEQYEAFRKKDKSSPFFLFNVTIQNHGGYYPANGFVDKGIEFTKDLEAEQALTFLNLMRASDDALKDMIAYFEKVEEPTVILLFGDHQPHLDEAFYEDMFAQHKDETEFEKFTRKYKVPLLLWANYELPGVKKYSKQTPEMSANYLAAFMKDAVGLPMTGFEKYLLSIHKELPVVSKIEYRDKNMKAYRTDEDTPLDDLLSQYRSVQYNGFTDHSHRVEGFFSLSR